MAAVDWANALLAIRRPYHITTTTQVTRCGRAARAELIIMSNGSPCRCWRRRDTDRVRAGGAGGGSRRGGSRMIVWESRHLLSAS
jgi:hypothetical protein